MPEAILVLLRHPEETHAQLGAAVRLAESMGGARINALAIRETVQITPAVATTLASRAGALLVAGEDERERVLTLEDAFVCWTVAAGRLAAEIHWFETEGGTTDIVAQWGRRADAIVVGRSRREDWLSRFYELRRPSSPGPASPLPRPRGSFRNGRFVPPTPPVGSEALPAEAGVNAKV